MPGWTGSKAAIEKNKILTKSSTAPVPARSSLRPLRLRSRVRVTASLSHPPAMHAEVLTKFRMTEKKKTPYV